MYRCTVFSTFHMGPYFSRLQLFSDPSRKTVQRYEGSAQTQAGSGLEHCTVLLRRYVDGTKVQTARSDQRVGRPSCLTSSYSSERCPWWSRSQVASFTARSSGLIA